MSVLCQYVQYSFWGEFSWKSLKWNLSCPEDSWWALRGVPLRVSLPSILSFLLTMLTVSAPEWLSDPRLQEVEEWQILATTLAGSMRLLRIATLQCLRIAPVRKQQQRGIPDLCSKSNRLEIRNFTSTLITFCTCTIRRKWNEETSILFCLANWASRLRRPEDELGFSLTVVVVSLSASNTQILGEITFLKEIEKEQREEILPKALTSLSLRVWFSLLEVPKAQKHLAVAVTKQTTLLNIRVAMDTPLHPLRRSKSHSVHQPTVPPQIAFGK